MGVHKGRLRASLKLILKRLGLLPAARWFRRLIMLLTKPEFRRRELELRRRERAHRQRFLRFKRQYGNVLRYTLNDAKHEQKRALVVGSGFPEVEIELGLIKALELAGFVPVALIIHERQNREYYNLAAVKEVHFWEEFCDPLDFTAAEAVIDRCRSVQELLTFEYAGARVGKLAVSTALRRLRLGSLDLQSTRDCQTLVKHLAAAMTSATAAQRILRQVRPELAIFVDWVYTPEGELFDTCLTQGIDAIAWDPAHKSNALMLRRYTLGDRDQHHASLSPESWRLLRGMEWTDAHREQLQQELYSAYASGDWYSAVGTQFNKRLMDADEIQKQLGLDPRKKTAFIFPHIFWDASLTWGKDLFHGYEEWFIETVRAACANDQVNWVIKIHPAHVGKSVQDGFHREPAEVIALREHIGALPPHVFFIPADSDISTFSLFEVMDYCLTVRGTVGIEAARLGIPVLTAGTGRYSHKGFTIDSEAREQYLERVARIQEIPRLSPAQREMAERYAYGLFLLRPLPLTTMTLEFHDTKSFLSKIGIKIRTKEEWYNASDLRAFAQWVTDSSQSDFLLPLPEKQDAPLLEPNPVSRWILSSHVEPESR